MPTDRYRAQRELISRSIARLDAQAVALEVEIGDPKKESVQALNRLGAEWCMTILTALGAVGSMVGGGVAVDGLLRADESVRQVQACIVQIEEQVSITQFITDRVGPWHDEQPDPPYSIPHDVEVYKDPDGLWLPADPDGEPIGIPEFMPTDEWRLWREQYHASSQDDRVSLLESLNRWR